MKIYQPPPMKIDGCLDCGNVDRGITGRRWFCTCTDSELIDMKTIPSDCPLEDVEEKVWGVSPLKRI